MQIQNISISKMLLLLFAFTVSGLNVKAAENPLNEIRAKEKAVSVIIAPLIADFPCKAQLVLGNIQQGDSPTLSDVTGSNKVILRCSDHPGVNPFYIASGTISVDGESLRGKITENGLLDANALEILSKSSGKQVTILVNFTDQAKNEGKTVLVFKVQA